MGQMLSKKVAKNKERIETVPGILGIPVCALIAYGLYSWAQSIPMRDFFSYLGPILAYFGAGIVGSFAALGGLGLAFLLIFPELPSDSPKLLPRIVDLDAKGRVKTVSGEQRHRLIAEDKTTLLASELQRGLKQADLRRKVEGLAD
jgi:hypothetical protein